MMSRWSDGIDVEALLVPGAHMLVFGAPRVSLVLSTRLSGSVGSGVVVVSRAGAAMDEGGKGGHEGVAAPAQAGLQLATWRSSYAWRRSRAALHVTLQSTSLVMRGRQTRQTADESQNSGLTPPSAGGVCNVAYVNYPLCQSCAWQRQLIGARDTRHFLCRTEPGRRFRSRAVRARRPLPTNTLGTVFAETEQTGNPRHGRHQRQQRRRGQQ